MIVSRRYLPQRHQLIYFPPQRTVTGRLILSASYEFQRCDGDLAVFQELECSPEYRRHIRFCIRGGVRRLDCVLGYAVHDLR